MARVMIDDNVGWMILGKGIVAGAGLCIDHCNKIELLKINLVELVKIESQITHQGPVLTASDGPAVGNRALNAGCHIGRMACRPGPGLLSFSTSHADI